MCRSATQTSSFPEAEPLLSQASRSPELESRRKAILLALANTKISLGDFSGADEALQGLQRLDNRFPALHRTLGILFQRERRIGEEQAEYHREFQISGDMQAERQAIELQRAMGAN